MKNYRFPIILLSSVIIGSILGINMGAQAEVIKPLGDIFLNLMFTLVVPLVFFATTSAIANMGSGQRFKKVMSSTFIVFLGTGLIAALVMVGAVKMFPGATDMNVELTKPESIETISAGEQLVGIFTTDNFIELFSREHMLALIFFSLLLGFAITKVGEKAKPLAIFMNAGTIVLTKMVNLVMYYAPIGLGAYFAYLVGTFGTNLLETYMKTAILYFIVAAVFFVVAYTSYAFLSGGKKGIKLFWSHMLSPTVTSLATCSSMASLPVNLEATEKMRIPKDIRETVIPLGASMHKDGSVLGVILKIAVLFSVFDMDFSGFGTIGLAMLIAVLGGTVMGAIPSGGMIAEMLIISLYGFPMEALPIIAAISTIIDAPATALNVTGDNASAMLVSRRVEGKDWIEKVEEV
ncbi:dicarboxylate/amino acid:cation symporter [Robertmurraya sp. FSL W8-0741]|uniref:dicarboxylate/amino acid:cation symporter n=1 Tax=Robertmurraya TaxID=2837507 RepID=UPI0010F5803B|nr:dicarboxylate/amino acid:cation symporter [Robertmurraya siralis]